METYPPPFIFFLVRISKSFCFPYEAAKLLAMLRHPFNCCRLNADFPSPAEQGGWDGLWEYLMTSVLPSQAVSFQMWSLSNPCRLLARICREATYIVMCLEWQIALLSPRGIVDFSQEGRLLLKMWSRRGWHYPLPPPPSVSSLIEIYYWQALGNIIPHSPSCPSASKNAITAELIICGAHNSF